MPQPKTKNGGKPTKSTYQKENAGRNRPAPGRAILKAHNLGQTVPLSISNVQRSGKFLLSQPSEYLRCLGVTLDGYQCSRVKYRHASDDTWSCQNHPRSKARKCKPSKVWYHRCEAITPGAAGRCRNSKSTSDEERAQNPWYCTPLHRFPQPQFDYTRSDEGEAPSHGKRVQREHAEDPKNALAERDSEVDRSDDTSSDEEDHWETPQTSFVDSPPSSPEKKAPQVSKSVQSQASVYESAVSRNEHDRVDEERLELIQREPAEPVAQRLEGPTEREPLKKEPPGWKCIEPEEQDGDSDVEGARLGVNAQTVHMDPRLMIRMECFKSTCHWDGIIQRRALDSDTRQLVIPMVPGTCTDQTTSDHRLGRDGFQIFNYHPRNIYAT
ncbi:hypothetical protein FIBSPDRAFT_928036 [Athelia psychrophila]|uniref:Uncharacterized protein n=1 Tax=Athelia psychrophila TaxID=1759441 RepID=A0A166QRL7_9AGAM|nr:hypothetical protein FIBSPDRAFT_928036 [Fibularhizoctonia sp. CBS 109695]